MATPTLGHRSKVLNTAVWHMLLWQRTVPAGFSFLNVYLNVRLVPLLQTRQSRAEGKTKVRWGQQGGGHSGRSQPSPFTWPCWSELYYHVTSITKKKKKNRRLKRYSHNISRKSSRPRHGVQRQKAVKEPLLEWRVEGFERWGPMCHQV